MKKAVIVLVLALVAGGFAMAQPVGGPMMGPYGRPLAPAYAQQPTETVKVDGTLTLINGRIGLKSGGKTYYTPMLGRYAGFIEGLKEGAFVRLEGYAYPLPAAPEYAVLRVTKLSVSGKEYDFSQFAYGGMGGFNMRGTAPRAGARGPRGW